MHGGRLGRERIAQGAQEAPSFLLISPGATFFLARPARLEAPLLGLIFYECVCAYVCVSLSGTPFITICSAATTFFVLQQRRVADCIPLFSFLCIAVDMHNAIYYLKESLRSCSVEKQRSTQRRQVCPSLFFLFVLSVCSSTRAPAKEAGLNAILCTVRLRLLQDAQYTHATTNQLVCPTTNPGREGR